MILHPIIALKRRGQWGGNDRMAGLLNLKYNRWDKAKGLSRSVCLAAEDKDSLCLLKCNCCFNILPVWNWAFISDRPHFPWPLNCIPSSLNGLLSLYSQAWNSWCQYHVCKNRHRFSYKHIWKCWAMTFNRFHCFPRAATLFCGLY